MRLWLMAGDQLFTGHTDLDPHPISVARAMPRMRQLDGNAARDNVGAVLLEPLGSLAHLGLYGVRAVDVMKNYLAVGLPWNTRLPSLRALCYVDFKPAVDRE